MRTHPRSFGRLGSLLCPSLALIFGLCAPIAPFTPSAEAATSLDKKKLKKCTKELRKQKALVRKFRKGLAAALAKCPPPFIEMITVPAGDLAENPADSTTYGAVPYDFQIGNFEVSLEEYAAFLNAVGKTDAGEPNGLYNTAMDTDENITGITRSGTNGSYVYTVFGSGKRPVTYVSWFDAARFCNWLHNGRPSGLQDVTTTERGAYTLDGATSGVGFARNPGAKYWIPSEDEWYKAAYHRPNSQGGPADHYFLYPTGSDTVPGNLIGPLPLANHANHLTPDSKYSVTQSSSFNGSQNYLTNGGSYPGSPSHYGTFDQGGNVAEWNDAVLSGSDRGLRGGSWGSSEIFLSSSGRDGIGPGVEVNFIGFRVASP